MYDNIEIIPIFGSAMREILMSRSELAAGVVIVSIGEGVTICEMACNFRDSSLNKFEMLRRGSKW